MLLAGLWLATKPFDREQAGEPGPAMISPESGPSLTETTEGEAQRAELLLRRFHRENDITALQAASGHALRALELDPESWRAAYANGLVQDARADYADARTFFARMREIEPGNALGYVAAAETYLAEGRLDLALHWLQLGQAVTPAVFDFSGQLVLLNDCLEDYAAAQQWSDWLDRHITNQPQIMALQARHHYLTGNFEAAIQTSNIALNLGLPDDWRSDAIFMRIKRDEAVARGTPLAGVDLFANHHPALLEPRPRITPANILQAVDLALLFKMAGQSQRAGTLAAAAIEAYGQPLFVSGSARAWLLPARAEALAVAGRHEAALDELERIIEVGWRIHWRWETEMNPNFSVLRDHSKFKVLVSRLENDMAEQRALSLAQSAAPPCPGCSERAP